MIEVDIQIHHGPMTHHHLLVVIIFVRLVCHQVKVGAVVH